MANILVVDDETAIRRALEKFLQSLGHQVFTAGDGQTALDHLAKQTVDLALVDLVMPKLDGISLIKRMKQDSPDLVSIVMTGFGTIATAVEAMRAGAYHYLTKPFELDEIASLIQTALEHRQLKQENKLLKRQVRERYRFDSIVGKSAEMESVFQLIEKVAETDSTVLILGESGTGKELIAKAIHYNSGRKEKPLVTVNCSAIPEELLESELFGHMRGSFTGAYTTTQGRFAAAHGGSIFLDEIGDMSPKLQVKLLRVLQERKVEPVGATEPQEIDVRILAATHQDLEGLVKAGRFREDLYYRLNVIPIHLAPLRERKDDIPLLVQHFIEKYKRIYKKEILGVAEDVKKLLLQHPWPGNIRELENSVERMVVLKKGRVLEAADLPEKIRGDGHRAPGESRMEIPETGLSLKSAVSGFEKDLILTALAKAKGNRNRAAGLLKLNRTTLVEKMKKQGLKGGKHVSPNKTAHR